MNKKTNKTRKNKKEGCELHQTLFKDEKQKMGQYGRKLTIISQKMESKSIEKKYHRLRKKCFLKIIKRYFNLENFTTLSGKA